MSTIDPVTSSNNSAHGAEAPPEDPAQYAIWLLKVIRDLQEPCICPGMNGHVNPQCPSSDLPGRVHHVTARTRAAARAAQRGTENNGEQRS